MWRSKWLYSTTRESDGIPSNRKERQEAIQNGRHKGAEKEIFSQCGLFPWSPLFGGRVEFHHAEQLTRADQEIPDWIVKSYVPERPWNCS